MNILKYKYLVGIDFGDGETTASYVKVNSDGIISRADNLLLFKGGVADKFKAESSVYIDKDGTYNLATRKDHWTYYPYEQNFKLRPDYYKEQKNQSKLKAFKEFVKLVFKNLLLYNNDKLQYNPKTGEKNFFLCVACPSKWVSNDLNHVYDYQNLLMSLIPVDVIIKESDAAFFHFIHDKRIENTKGNILVIDYGSSTIDYTYYNQNSTDKFIDCDGSRETIYGAQKVEQTIYDYIKQYSTEYATAQNFIKQNNLNPDNKILINNRHKKIIKDEKEYYYGVDSDKFAVQDMVENTFICNPPSNCRYFFNVNYSEAEFENVIRPYKNLIQEEFIRIAKNPKWKPDFIIITGGASRMGWVERMVKDIFYKNNKNIHVISDTSTASYVVSHGIVKYLTAYHSYCAKLEITINDFKTDYLKNESLEQVLCLAAKNSISPYFANEIGKACDEYIMDNRQTTLDDLINRIDKVYEELGRRLGASTLSIINTNMTHFLKDYYTDIVESKINNMFKESFLIDMDLEFDFPHKEYWTEFLTITGSSRYDVVEAAGPIVKSWIFDEVNTEKDRDEATRRIIAIAVKKAFDTIDNIQSIERNTLIQLCEKINESVDKYFEGLSQQLPLKLYNQL